jgi:hypothetical protein
MYPHLLSRVEQNIYFIATSGSRISIEDYIHVMKDIPHAVMSLKSDIIPLEIQNVEDTCIRVDEMFIDPRKARDHFEAILQPYMVTGTTGGYDYVIDCTYNQRNPIDFDTYELYITLLYSIRTPTTFAYTVMDGNFFSIYPYDIDNQIYTLTSVKHGVLLRTTTFDEESSNVAENIVRERRAIIEEEVKECIPQWDSYASYAGYYVSWKTKPKTTTDDRSLRMNIQGKTITLYGGKITGIFHAENEIHKQLGL